MTFPISSVAGVSAPAPTAYLPPAQGADPAQELGGSVFENTLGTAVDSLQAMQSQSRQLSVDAVTGDLQDLHAATIASAQASVALETITTFRNRGVEAFNEVMRMQA